jgi:hypothetical protein
MQGKPLPPEACLDLKISLDRLSQLEEQCRDGLGRWVDGELSKEAYMRIVRQQQAAQKAWEERYLKYVANALGR